MECRTQIGLLHAQYMSLDVGWYSQIERERQRKTYDKRGCSFFYFYLWLSIRRTPTLHRLSIPYFYLWRLLALEKCTQCLSFSLPNLVLFFFFTKSLKNHELRPTFIQVQSNLFLFLFSFNDLAPKKKTLKQIKDQQKGSIFYSTKIDILN